MKKIFSTLFFTLLIHAISAQGISEIMKFSTCTNAGSARVIAMGGAFTALGEDLSASGINPAGVGIYQRSEVCITPTFHIANSRAKSRGVNDNSYPLGTLGGVFVFHRPLSQWKYLNLAFNYTHLNNFNRVVHQHVYDPATSYHQIWAEEANKTLLAIYPTGIPEDIDFSNTLTGRPAMAHDAMLITFNGESRLFESTLLPGEEIKQRTWIKEDGYQGEYDLSVGTNYNDKLYLGMTIGLQTIHYKYKSIFTSKADNANFFLLDQYSFGQYTTTKGWGTNLKFGIIYRPIHQLRVGAAIHSPTFYSMSTDGTEDMHSTFKTPDENGDRSYIAQGIPFSYDYNMQTPWKATFGLAATLFTKLNLSVDYEFINYTSAKYSNGYQGEDFHEPDQTGVNDLIKNELKKNQNIKAGAEYCFNSSFCLRAGYTYWGFPYKTEDLPTYLKSNHHVQSISAGLGLNFARFYIDAAYVYKFSKDITTSYFYQDPYDSDYDIIAQPIHNKYIDHEGRISLGLRF